jgi:hypothetical protein
MIYTIDQQVSQESMMVSEEKNRLFFINNRQMTANPSVLSSVQTCFDVDSFLMAMMMTFPSQKDK